MDATLKISRPTRTQIHFLLPVLEGGAPLRMPPHWEQNFEALGFSVLHFGQRKGYILSKGLSRMEGLTIYSTQEKDLGVVSFIIFSL